MSKEISFEKAFERLEQILEKLNSETISLDESLKLFEEADKLIADCGSRLEQAEKKVEKLIKARSGELVLDENNQPQTEDFNG